MSQQVLHDLSQQLAPARQILQQTTSAKQLAFVSSLGHHDRLNGCGLMLLHQLPAPGLCAHLHQAQFCLACKVPLLGFLMHHCFGSLSLNPKTLQSALGTRQPSTSEFVRDLVLRGVCLD